MLSPEQFVLLFYKQLGNNRHWAMFLCVSKFILHTKELHCKLKSYQEDDPTWTDPKFIAIKGC